MSVEKEISFKEFIYQIKKIINYLFSKWIVIGIAGILCGLIGMMYAWNSKPTYTASLSFILSGNTDMSSGLLGLANQFGLNMGGSSGTAFSSDNIITLMTSDNLVRKALQTKAPEQKESLVNNLCRQLKLDERWNGAERTRGAFPFPPDSVKMTLVQDSLLRFVTQMVKETFFSILRPDKMQSIFIVKTTSRDELFSFYLTNNIVDATANFYIDTKTKTAKENLAMLQHEADSLKNLLRGSISSTAKVYDNTFNLNPALQSLRAPAQEGQMNIEVAGTAYGEVLKNLELAKITLQQQKPLYQIIDAPRLPLIAEKPGRMMSSIIGGILGGILMCGFLILRRMFKSL